MIPVRIRRLAIRRPVQCKCGKRPIAHSILCERCAIRDRLRLRALPPIQAHVAMSYEEIGMVLGMNKVQVKTTVETALRKLRRNCRRFGLDVTDIIGRPTSNMARAEMWAADWNS